MDADWDLIIEDYLDGALCAKEANRLEHNLALPEIARAFAEALMLRELLKTSPPDQPPMELIKRLEAELIWESQGKSKRRWFGKTRSVFSGAAWAVRGPAMMVPDGPTGTRETLAGIGTIRYTLGPLVNRGSQRSGRQRRGWWKRILGRR